MKHKGISVVIPTYNSKCLLSQTLDSLCVQLVSFPFEVLVADDGSTDETEQLVLSYRSRLDIRYFYQSDDGFRAAAARNLGIRNSKFDTILFLDAGIVVSSLALSKHFELHEREQATAVIALSYGVLDYSTRSAEIIDLALESGVEDALEMLSHRPETFDSRTAWLKSVDFDLRAVSAPWLIFWSGHISVQRQILIDVGGFDEAFRRWGGEDNELGIRLFQAGCEFKVLDGVHSIHIPHDKNPMQKWADARSNSIYIDGKHHLSETSLMLRHGWQCIVSGDLDHGDHGCPFMPKRV